MINSSSDSAQPSACRFCGETLLHSDNFCRRCGKAVKTTSPKRLRALVAASVGTTVVLVIVAMYGTSIIQRANGSSVKPKASSHENPHERAKEGGVPSVSEVALAKDPAMSQLLERARSAPQDPEPWRALGRALLTEIAAAPSSTEIQFDALDIFSYLLTISPDDPLALRALGDLCFDQRLFPKSLSYYERYLKLNPQDHEIRSRRASTLTFVGRADEAVSELTDVVKHQPDAFQPLAYLSIALSQKGDISQARIVGEQALAKAPSAEARERFQQFLSGLTAAQEVKTEAKEMPQQISEGSTWLVSLRDTIKNNPIAGPKFDDLSFSSSDKAVTLLFSNFPMEGMPPFARTKFISSITNSIPADSAGSLIFRDKESGRVMHTENISEATR